MEVVTTEWKLEIGSNRPPVIIALKLALANFHVTQKLKRLTFLNELPGSFKPLHQILQCW
jgi:hypothetical protein